MKSSLSSASKKKTIFKRKGFWALVVVLLVAGGGAAWYFLAGPMAVKAQSSALQVAAGNTTTVKRGNLQVTVTGSGTLTAGQTADLSFSTGGTVSAVNVKLGDMVTAGQVLAQVDGASALQSQIASLKLQLLQAQQALTTLQQNGDVSLAQAYQDWVKAQAAYNDAVTANEKTAYARCSQDVITKYKAQMDLWQSHLDELSLRSVGTDAWINASNSFATAQANYNYCISYTPSEKTSAQANVQVTKTALDQADANYKTLQKASGIDPNALALDQAKIESLQTQLDQANQDLKGITLTAPFAGKVVYLASGAGTIVGTDKFITVADISQPEITVNVDEADMDNFVLGSKAEITFDAIPDQTYLGTVTQVDPSLTTSGQYKVLKGVIQLDPIGAKAVANMPLGLSATVKVIYKEVNNALLVPVTALKEISGKGYQVALINSDGTSQLKSVQVGLKDSTTAQILSGLSEGDTISKIIENASTTRSTKNQNNGGFFPGGNPGGGPPPGD